jgi:hypothetical protein
MTELQIDRHATPCATTDETGKLRWRHGGTFYSELDSAERARTRQTLGYGSHEPPRSNADFYRAELEAERCIEIENAAKMKPKAKKFKSAVWIVTVTLFVLFVIFVIANKIWGGEL